MFLQLPNQSNISPISPKNSVSNYNFSFYVVLAIVFVRKPFKSKQLPCCLLYAVERHCEMKPQGNSLKRLSFLDRL